MKRTLLDNLNEFEKKHKGDTRQASNQIRVRTKRLLGVLQWQIDMEYDKRLADLQGQLQQLDIDEADLAKKYDSFFSARQMASQSFDGYSDQIQQLKKRIRDNLGKVKKLTAKQGHELEEMAINELGTRRKQLEEYQVQAVFAMADSYDRARKKQNAESRPK